MTLYELFFCMTFLTNSSKTNFSNFEDLIIFKLTFKFNRRGNKPCHWSYQMNGTYSDCNEDKITMLNPTLADCNELGS